MPNVSCSVHSCLFWVQGNRCSARNIEVNNMLCLEQSFQRVGKCDETSCKTFRHK